MEFTPVFEEHLLNDNDTFGAPDDEAGFFVFNRETQISDPDDNYALNFENASIVSTGFSIAFTGDLAWLGAGTPASGSTEPVTAPSMTAVAPSILFAYFFVDSDTSFNTPVGMEMLAVTHVIVDKVDIGQLFLFFQYVTEAGATGARVLDVETDVSWIAQLFNYSYTPAPGDIWTKVEDL